MSIFSKEEKSIALDIDVTDLSESQIRLIKSINTMLNHVITTESEDEFFEGSAEFMRMCASLIKQSRFASELKTSSDIPYAEQALEYSMDVLQEHILRSKVVHYDN